MNNMTEVTTTTDTSRLPPHVGYIENSTKYGAQLKIKSMHALQEWILEQIDITSPDTEHHDIIVTGKMPNCIALQIGLCVSGYGTVYYKSAAGLSRRMNSNL